MTISAVSDCIISSMCSIAGVQEDIDKLLASNNFMLELHARIVPDIVESIDFWSRYFYRYVVDCHGFTLLQVGLLRARNVL